MCYVCSIDVYIALPNWAIAQWWTCCSRAHRPGSNLWYCTPQKKNSPCLLACGFGAFPCSPAWVTVHASPSSGWPLWAWVQVQRFLDRNHTVPSYCNVVGAVLHPPIECFYVYIALTEAILLLKWLELVLRRNNCLNQVFLPPMHSWFLRTVWFHGPLPCDFEKWGFLSQYLRFYSLHAWW